jgi:hypothetical protein
LAHHLLLQAKLSFIVKEKYMNLPKAPLLKGLIISGMFALNTAFAFDIGEKRTLSKSASNVKEFAIKAGAGFLVVKGESGASDIRVEADLQVDEGNYELSLDVSGDTAELIADANTANKSNWFGDSPKIDLTVAIPANIKLNITDGSGSLTVTNVNGDLHIKDGSGSMEVTNIGGNAVIYDGSGSIEVKNIHGSLTIDDGSGSIDIRKVSNAIVIDDGSGGMNIVDAGASVQIEDGSGSILIKGAKGHVIIDDGSGGIDLEDLEDGVTIIEAGSGGLSMTNVKGKVEKR